MKEIRLFTIVLILSLLFGCPPSITGPEPITPGIPVNLTIKVMDAFSGTPIGNARVSIQQDGKSLPNLRDIPSDGGGIATFPGVPSGVGYKVFANNVPGYTPGASPSIKLSADMEITIAMSPSTSANGSGLIAGSVKSRDKQEPMAGVTVSLQPAGLGGPPTALSSQSVRRQQLIRRPQTRYPYPPPYRIQQIGVPGGGANIRQTDASGQFTFENIPAGNYELSFSFSGLDNETSSVTVNSGDIATVETVFMGVGGTVGGQGQLLIAEAGRAYQISPQGQTIWNHAGRQISSADVLENGNILVSDEGQNDVLVVSHLGQVIWNAGRAIGIFKNFNLPGWADAAADGKSFVVADTGNNRIVEFQGTQANWSQSFEYTLGLNRPRSATYSKTGTIIVADTGNKRVVEVERTGQVLWAALKDLGAPVHAQRLEDGNTLITDSLFNRVIMVNQAGQSVWFYDGVNGGPPDPAGGLNRPRSAFKDPTTGNIFIVDTGNNRIIEVGIDRSIVNTISPVNAPASLTRY